MPKRKRKLSSGEKRARRERKRKYMTIFVNGKQKRVPRPQLIDGLPVDEFIARNADPIWLHQNGLWELMTPNDEGLRSRPVGIQIAPRAVSARNRVEPDQRASTEAPAPRKVDVVEVVLFEQLGEIGLREIARRLGVVALKSNERIEGIPISATKRFEGSTRFGGRSFARGKDLAPTRR